MQPAKSTLYFFSLLLVTGILGGGMPVFIKIGVVNVSPIFFSCLRFAVCSLALLALYPLFRNTRCNWGNLSALTLSSLGNTGNVVLFSIGIPYTSPAFSQVLYLLCPVLVYLGSVVMLRQSISRAALGGALLGILGGSITVLSRFELRAELPGIILVFAAVVSYTWFAISSKPLQQNFSPFFQTLIMSVLQVAVLFVLACLFEQKLSLKLTGPAISALLYVGIFGSALYFLLIQYLIKLSGAFSATSVLYIQPIAALAWEQVFFAEPISPLFLAGAALCISGAWLISRHSLVPAAPD